MFDTKFLARNLALVGAVCLLLAEVMGETRTIFAGVPTLDDNQSKNYLQLSGEKKKVKLFSNFFFRPNPTDFDVHDAVALHDELEGLGRQPGRPVDDGPGGGWLQDQARLPHHGLLAPLAQLCHERLLATPLHVHHVGLQKIRLFPGKNRFFHVFHKKNQKNKISKFRPLPCVAVCSS